MMGQVETRDFQGYNLEADPINTIYILSFLRCPDISLVFRFVIDLTQLGGKKSTKLRF